MRLQHGLSLAAAGRQREAIAPLSTAIALLDSLLGGRKAATRTGRNALATIYAKTGDSARARRLRAEADSLR
ncbi:MAG: hypothetical protein U5K74_13035 [Gemmatimonadaceae bacterium]|nr:hypothetical protein [Gemmatimonadaceae bacterium]